MPLVIIAGYAATSYKFENREFEYLGLTTASVIASLLLTSSLKRRPELTAPVWLFLLLFIGAYYFKFYWLLYDPSSVSSVWFPHLHWIIDSPGILLDVYATMACAFIGFCATAWLLIVVAKPLRLPRSKKQINYAYVASNLLWVIPVLMAVSSYLMYMTGIAIMAAGSVYLPFRLAGLIFYTRVGLIPALLLLLIWCSDEGGLQRHFRTGIMLVCLHGVSDILLRSSKGALLVLFILLGFLFVVSGRMTAQRVWFLISVGGLNILLWPLILSYRSMRDPTGGIIVTLTGAIRSMSLGEEDLSKMLSEVLAGFISRVTGIEGPLAIVGSGFQPVGVAGLFDPLVARTYTIEVLGYSPQAIHASAPGLMGWFHMVGGHYLAAVGVVASVLLTWYFWSVLGRMRLICRPVAQALFLGLVFAMAMDGMLNHLGAEAFTTVTSIGVCELLIRGGRRPHWLKTPR